MDPNILSVLIRNRDGVVFEGECLSLSSYNDVGKFDVLRLHANFISLVQKEITIVTKNGDSRTIGIDNGVCKVKENKIIIFLSIKQTSKSES